ncbi:hypothetical protein CGLO_04747 [Colletotrichum gloeosporioides Cg-14]|uniref:Uncharacterized protein n=1 Tax=Colletotrichum gloeosporioides (strain Cg-14) TaxID=1237896 RepID=T0KRN9_COLGC|nr:hypothetical protein CGLO_04747 [Colletotrichum gloeosporioides Cg-14]
MAAPSRPGNTQDVCEVTTMTQQPTILLG